MIAALSSLRTEKRRIRDRAWGWLHQPAIADGEATMDCECPVSNAVLKREFARLRRAVSWIEDSAFLVDCNCVTDLFPIESGDDAAIEALAERRSVFVHLVDLKSEKVQVACSAPR